MRKYMLYCLILIVLLFSIVVKREIFHYDDNINIALGDTNTSGDVIIRFISGKRVLAIFKSNAISYSGGEVLACTSKVCGSVSAIHKKMCN